jgi:hypothetical protein
MPLSMMRSAGGVTWPPPAISVLNVPHLGARRCRGQGVVAQRGIDEVGDGRAKGAQHLDALR